ncbi:hypothetical protein D4768_17285 [Rhodococcus erythropolis]|nr:hypothetical protein D4768_17285 [Rhodococcus erythropolis]
MVALGYPLEQIIDRPCPLRNANGAKTGLVRAAQAVSAQVEPLCGADLAFRFNDQHLMLYYVDNYGVTN